MTRRRWLLTGTLCIAAVGGVLAFERSQMATPAPKNAAVVPLAGPVQTEAAKPGIAKTETSPRIIAAEASADLFAPKSWYVAPPPPPPPAPTAPPFPYVLMGSQRDGGEITLFVMLGERNYILHQGDVIDTNYRLDEIKNGVAVFTYLPLHQKQTLQIGTNE